MTGLYKLVKVKSWEDQRSGHCVKHYMCSLTLSSTTLSFPFHIRENGSVEELSKFAQRCRTGSIVASRLKPKESDAKAQAIKPLWASYVAPSHLAITSLTPMVTSATSYQTVGSEGRPGSNSGPATWILDRTLIFPICDYTTCCMWLVGG